VRAARGRASSTPTGRAATCAFIGSPSPAASAISPSSLRQPSGAVGVWSTVIDIGRPDVSTIARSSANSECSSSKSPTASITPQPASPSPRAMPSSSAWPAVRLGVKAPSRERWFFVRDVVKPIAPASTASRASSDMRAISSLVGSAVWSPPRLPIT